MSSNGVAELQQHIEQDGVGKKYKISWRQRIVGCLHATASKTPSSIPSSPTMAHKKAKELYAERKYREALEVCKQARQEPGHRSQEQEVQLVDEICMHSAATGDIIGFDGRVLQVLPSDPSIAWLGLTGPGTKQHTHQQQPSTFNSIAEAIEAAADGDTVQLLPGTHVVSQVCLSVAKRVLIEGLGATPEQVVLDHRANHPAFNITRSCILRNFSIDMVGFCEAITISATSCIKPIFRELIISCSGDDGMSVGAKAQPLLHHCSIQARHCGIKHYASSSSTLWQCSITAGQHGLMVCGSSQVFLEGCSIENCGQDGVVGLQQSSVHLTNSCITGCKGPGLDMCDESSASLKNVEVKECCGGVWLWQSASCEAISSYISGGSSYAVLLDSEAYARGSSCTIDGPCHDTSEEPLPGNQQPTAAIATKQQQHQQPCMPQQQQGSPAAPHIPPQHCEQPAAQPGLGGSQDDATLRGSSSAAAPNQPPAQHQVSSPSLYGSCSSYSTYGGCQAYSPFSSGSCSDRSSQDVAVYYMGSMPADGKCSSRLVDSSMLVEGAVAAALFPAEEGAFVYEQQMF